MIQRRAVRFVPRSSRHVRSSRTSRQTRGCPRGERSFARVTYLYAVPEHIPSLEAVIKEFGELSKRKGIADGYNVYSDG
jgi:hypothetical protein